MPVAPGPQQLSREAHPDGGGREPRPDGGTPARPRIPRPRAPEASHAVARTLRQNPGEVRRARHLTAWGLAGIVHVIELITSEPAANAVRHAAPPIRLTLARGRHLRCAVVDTGRRRPSPHHADEEDERGRGRYLVANLALALEATGNRTGKTVWTLVPMPGATTGVWRSP
ncbi:ATP-binding protein [Streptomyces sp. NPDC050485]|uniref:ATP-binding protein n=1 Tax=Streptomyces sp. NPDC050485 TaxID=3365617 RepID=UPI0037A0D55E